MALTFTACGGDSSSSSDEPTKVAKVEDLSEDCEDGEEALVGDEETVYTCTEGKWETEAASSSSKKKSSSSKAVESSADEECDEDIDDCDEEGDEEDETPSSSSKKKPSSASSGESGGSGSGGSGSGDTGSSTSGSGESSVECEISGKLYYEDVLAGYYVNHNSGVDQTAALAYIKSYKFGEVYIPLAKTSESEWQAAVNDGIFSRH